MVLVCQITITAQMATYTELKIRKLKTGFGKEYSLKSVADEYAYKGMLPCFFRGMFTTLFSSIL